jgi:uncharacterized membrane protein YfcA
VPDLAALMVVDWTVFAIAFAVVIVAAVAQSSIGIGFGIVSAPILAVLDPTLVPGPVLLLAGSTSLLVVLRDRADLRLGHLGWALGGRVLFSLLGALTASLLSPDLFLLVFGGLILLAVALSLSGMRVQPNRRTLFVAGCASGFMGTITSVGTPPMAIVYQYAPGAEVRANMSAFLVAGAAISIASLALFGEFGVADLLLALKLAPAMVLGYWLSGPVKRATDAGLMRPAMLALCIAAAGLLIWKGAAALLAA